MESIRLSTSERHTADEALRLLCDAGAVLFGTDPYPTRLTRLGERLTESLAELCLVDVVERDREVVRVAVVHRDPALAAAAKGLRRFPPDLDEGGHPVARAMRMGASLLVAPLEEGWLEANVGDLEHRGLLRSLHPQSLIVAPLTAGDRVLGAITLVSLDPSRRYGAGDLKLAEELGRRAALIVDHARLREEAQEASRAAAEFLGAMTHEFRTPVHIASMYAELLLLGVPEPVPAAARRHVAQIRTATRHLDELVTQVLAFSRLESERDVAREERVELVGLARETAALVEPLARQKGLGYGADLPKDGIVAWTDPNKLRQILFNLLGNAVKFTAEGEVSLSLRAGGEWVSLEVRDTGMGIAPEHRERIFEPFWQADRESTPGGQGTGLGLGIVQRLVRLLHGRVEVESTPGSGSVFRIVLPRRAGPA